MSAARLYIISKVDFTFKTVRELCILQKRQLLGIYSTHILPLSWHKCVYFCICFLNP